MITGKLKTVIEGFENYQINMSGEISLLNCYCPDYDVYGTLSKRIDRAGYYSVRLSRNGKTYTKMLHRLLAEAFIPNPLNLPEVDHVDGNKLNLKLTNLRWCTHAQNTKYAYSLGLNSAAKKVIDAVTGKEFASISEAASAIGMNYNTCCKRLEKNSPDLRLRYLR